MYKPNGEELMTKQEEMRRRQAGAYRTRKEAGSDSMRTAFYAALFGASSPRDRNSGSTFEQVQ
jgi:hypothetical protein